jgi:hypothetical protein
MWTLSRSTRSGRGSAATGSIVVSPVLAFGLQPLRRGFEIATALKRRPSGERVYPRPRGLPAAHIWMGEPLPYENSRHLFALGFQ